MLQSEEDSECQLKYTSEADGINRVLYCNIESQNMPNFSL